MAFDFIPLAIPDILLIKSTCHIDKRGYFTEMYRRSAFTRLKAEFVQDNLVRSAHQVLRGLHLQLKPKAQGKLIQVVRGEIFDVVVDLRVNSDTFGEWVGIKMVSEERVQLWVPPGFAHGFLGMEKENLVMYGCTKYRNKKSETGIKWNDKNLKINWNIKKPILSKKDEKNKSLNEVIKKT